MSTTGRKTMKEKGCGFVEAGPDDPIYKRNWIVGSRNSTPLSKGTPPDDKEKPPTDEGQPGPLDGRLASSITPEEERAMFKRMQNFQGIIPASNPPEEEE